MRSKPIALFLNSTCPNRLLCFLLYRRILNYPIFWCRTGLASYNILHNPRYKEGFAISWRFAMTHQHVRSIRLDKGASWVDGESYLPEHSDAKAVDERLKIGNTIRGGVNHKRMSLLATASRPLSTSSSYSTVSRTRRTPSKQTLNLQTLREKEVGGTGRRTPSPSRRV